MSPTSIEIFNGAPHLLHPTQRKSGRPRLYAFIDESGAAGGCSPGNEFFVLGAAVIHEANMEGSEDYLKQVRRELRRSPTDTLHFKNIRLATGQRARAASLLNVPQLDFLAVATHKAAFAAGGTWTHEKTYFWTITLLLERLSWMAKRRGCDVEVTIAHKRHTTRENLRAHEDRLRRGGGVSSGNNVEWDHLRKYLRSSTPEVTEQLQFADFFVSMLGAALNGEGNPPSLNLSYIAAVDDRIWCSWQGVKDGYGLKIHPASSVPAWVRA